MIQGQLTAYTEFEVNLIGGATYIAKSYSKEKDYAYMWIENFKTGEAITPKRKVRRQVTGSIFIML
jgi:hypothetical protein